MKTLIWKIRYAWRMKQRLQQYATWAFCWESAGLSLDNDADYVNWHPYEVCDEDLSCWSD